MDRTINRLRPHAADRTTQPEMSRTPKPKAARPATRTAYLVLGMHRSGTSAITQLLALAGAELPANVMPGDEHNQKGYFEPWKIAIFNDERLRAAGSAWDDPFAYPYRPLADAEDQAWLGRALALFDEEFPKAAWPLMKDPRATVLLPFWRRVLEARGVGARCVIPVRHPLAVAGSLRRRDGFAEQKSVLVWTAYMLAAEAYTRDLPRAFVGYDALLADWRSEMARIEAAHGAPLPDLTPAAARKIDKFLTPELRHNAGDDGLAALGWAGDIAARTHAWFAERAAGGEPDPSALEAAAADLARRAAEIAPLGLVRDLATARADALAMRERALGAEVFQQELRDEMERQRVAMEEFWRREALELEIARSTLSQINAELDVALAE
ncbi:MAG: hypothetical protein DI570_06335 [Phenylobacterium zucineum]|nr:MAG: hypothetical protein DI570_06335 [Phenylobacterium zucineum]